MSFEEGHKLAKARPKGSRNKLGREFDQAFEESKARGYTHPFLRMMEIANDESQPTERRDTMLLAAASYACPKAGTIQHQFVAEVQQPTSIEQAENILSQLFVELAPELDPIQLVTVIKAWIESKRAGAELDHKLHPPETRPQLIQIVGGLGTAPGHESVLMPRNENGSIVQPQSNGAPLSRLDGHASSSVIESSANEITPGELKAQGPHPLQKHRFEPDPDDPGKNSSTNGGQEP
jgi:hypothetical protein